MSPSAPELEFGFDLPVDGSLKDSLLPYLASVESTLLPVVARHFSSIWSYDHFYSFKSSGNAYLESWTTLTWLAARYPALKVGSIVLGVGYRNPALLARMAATLQTLSGGRLVLGLGAGWRQEEFHAYGYPFPSASARIHQLEEAIQVIRVMWTEDDPNFTGRDISIEHAYCFPHPVPLPPIMVGGEGEQLMLPLIARQADWWNAGGMSDAATLLRKRDLLFRAAENAGRDPATLRLTVERSRYAWPLNSSASRQWLVELEPLVGMGFTLFMINGGIPDSPECIDRFAEEVMAPLRN